MATAKSTAPGALASMPDSEPVINVQPVASGAAGSEAFAKTLGQLAGTAESQVEERLTDQSQAMYINSVANIEQLKTGAQMRMLQNPGEAQKISDQTTNIMGEVKDNAFVNSKDRARLNAYIQGAQDDVALKATAQTVRQSQLEAAFTHYQNWPSQLQAYSQALLTDHDKAEQLKTAMINTLHGLVTTGSLTPEQAGSSIKTMGMAVQSAQDHYAMYGNQDVSAKDYHTVTSNPLSPPNLSANGSEPINTDTAWLVNHRNSDLSFQGVIADISKHMLPNPQAFDSLEPAQRQHAILAMQGVQVADGIIKSGEPFPSIEKSYQVLNNKGANLSYRESATRDALNQYITDLKNGNMLSVMNRDPQGSAIMNDFIARNDAINKTFTYSPESRDAALLQNKNDMVNAAVAWADGRHIPREYTQPISQTEVANVENAFKLGQNPMTVLQTLGSYTKQNRTYLAQAMKDPNQRMVVQALAFAPDTIKPQDKLDFIAANQEGRTYVNKEIESPVKEKELYTRVYTALAPQLQAISQHYNREDAPVMQNAMINTTVKYAKYLAAQDNNAAMNDKSTFLIGTASWKTYADKATGIYANSFGQMSSTNYSINPNQLPSPMTRGQLDMVANYAINKGYEYLKGGRSSAEYESAIGRNPLKMVLSPTNDIQAVDGNGKVYFSVPFSPDVVTHAVADAKAREADRKKAIARAYEENVKQQLNVRIP